MNEAQLKELVSRVRSGLRVTRIVATRSLKGRAGETTAGFSGELLSDSGESKTLTLQEAIVANCLLAREADLAAIRNAIAGGNLPLDQGAEAIALVKSGYAKLLAQSLSEVEGSNG